MFDLDHQIAIDVIFGFSSIFYKNGVAHGIIAHIFEHSEIVDSMNSDGPVVSVIDGVATDVRLVHSANHMVMQRISTQFESLAHIFHFKILNATN